MEFHVAARAPIISRRVVKLLPSNCYSTTKMNNNITANSVALRRRADTHNNIRVVNLDVPEQNGGVVLIKKTDIIVNDHLHDRLHRAYRLEINADARYAYHPQNWYRAFVHGNRDVIVQFPSPFSGFNLTNEERQLITICFVFPEDLDNTIFSPNAMENSIEPRFEHTTTAAFAKVCFTIACS